MRVRGEARGGFFGLEMVHPAFKAVTRGDAAADGADAGLPEHGAAAAGLSAQGGRRRRCARADLDEILPAGTRAAAACRRCARRCRSLHQPAPEADAAALEDRAHPAWQRLKFEELLAQQLSQLQAKRERAARSARRLLARRAGALHEALAAPRCRSR